MLKWYAFSCNENKTLDFYFHLPTFVKTILVGTCDLRPTGKGGKKKRKEKTLVVTLGRFDAYTANPLEKGEKKKKKKTLGINSGQPTEPRFQDLDLKTSVSGPGFHDSNKRTIISSFSHHFSLRPSSLFFFLSCSLHVQWSETNCVQWSQMHAQTHRQVN
jgi:hypothetical protein